MTKLIFTKINLVAENMVESRQGETGVRKHTSLGDSGDSNPDEYSPINSNRKRGHLRHLYTPHLLCRGIKVHIKSTWGNSVDLCCPGTKVRVTQDLSLLEGKHKTTPQVMSQPEWAVSGLCSNTDWGSKPASTLTY